MEDKLKKITGEEGKVVYPCVYSRNHYNQDIYFVVSYA
jgi:hypothetical protein